MSQAAILQSDIKRHVTVLAEHRADGNVVPLTLIWMQDGEEREYTIDKAVYEGSRPAQRGGGLATRYRIRIGRRETYLFFDSAQQRWFVEKR